jgi:hypothetical protein
MSGFAFRMVMLEAGFEDAASGPGSGATPGKTGGVNAFGSAEACAGRSSTPVSSAAMSMSFLVLMMVLSFGFTG